MMERLLFFPLLRVNQIKLQQQLTGKRVLITGATYGIGECLADRLADTDAYLLLVTQMAVIDFRPELPYTTLGKLDKKALQSA